MLALTPKILNPKPLTQQAFEPYGEVIDLRNAAKQFDINFGLATRYHDVAQLGFDSTEADAGKLGFSLLTTQATPLPLQVRVMEYHPLGCQLFYPMDETAFLVLVAPAAEELDVTKLELFITDGKQGVNYHAGTWHHYLLPLLKDNQSSANFIIVDRIGSDKNCIETKLNEGIVITINE